MDQNYGAICQIVLKDQKVSIHLRKTSKLSYYNSITTVKSFYFMLILLYIMYCLSPPQPCMQGKEGAISN